MADLVSYPAARVNQMNYFERAEPRFAGEKLFTLAFMLRPFIERVP